MRTTGPMMLPFSRSEGFRKTSLDSVNSRVVRATSDHEILCPSHLENESPRILHLVSSGGLYGAEQVILNLAASTNTTSYVGALYNGHRQTLDVIAEAEERDLRTVVFDSRGRINPKPILQVSRFLREHGIDILHSHGYKSDVVGFLATLSGNAKWIATNHVWHPLSSKLRLYETVDAFVLRFARRVVAVSREIREDLICANVPSANIRVIGNGIDIDRFGRVGSQETLKSALGIPRRDIVVTIVGRLSPEKGHRTFLEAAGRLSSHEKGVTFLIVGDGPMHDELRAQTLNLNLEKRVIFTGFRRDMPQIYALTDVMVNASSIEGLPMTILEAMASRVPVIAARIGGIPDLITDNDTGLLIDPDDVEGLRVKLESLIDDAAKRQRLAAAALEHVAMNHSFERMCDDYREVYSDVMCER